MWINLEKSKSRYKKTRQYLDKVSKNGNALRRKTKEHGIQYDQDTYDSFFGFSGESIKEPPTKNNTKEENPEEKEQKPEHTTTLTKVNIALKIEQVKSKKIQNEYEKGRLVERDKIENLFFEISRRVRDSLESIPARISGLLVEKNKHEIEQILIQELKSTLTNLSLEI